MIVWSKKYYFGNSAVNLEFLNEKAKGSQIAIPGTNNETNLKRCFLNVKISTLSDLKWEGEHMK